MPTGEERKLTIVQRNQRNSNTEIIAVVNMVQEKGVVLVRLENGKEVVQTKYIYLRMKHAGRKIELVKEAEHASELS
jgi:hypothetical protein